MPDLPAQLARLNLTLPTPPAAVASYVPAVRVGDLITVSGQLPMRDGKMVATGPVPSATSIESAQDAARQCILNGLAQVGHLIDNDWLRLTRVVRLGVFVCSDAGFDQQHIVANGASDLLFELLGETGRHARAAVGVIALPLAACVEIEMTVQIAGVAHN